MGLVAYLDVEGWELRIRIGRGSRRETEVEKDDNSIRESEMKEMSSKLGTVHKA